MSKPKQKIKKANAPNAKRLEKIDTSKLKTNEYVIFSFENLDKNEYFNLDGTCVNWSSDLFDMLKQVSKIEVKRIYNGEFSGEGSPLRIHTHGGAKLPCDLPIDKELEEVYQLRISARKGGVHGFFIDNVFYVVWLDPQHNMYPDDRFGGLKIIKPPSTCCKERENEFEKIYLENSKLKEENTELWKEVAPACE